MKNVIAALALVVAAPALAGPGDHDVGVAGVDYEKLVDPVVEVVKSDIETLKSCGVGAQGCAILGFARDENNERYARCNVFVKTRSNDIVLRHEMKHCFGYVHEEMPSYVMKRTTSFQNAWIERAHKHWDPLPADTLDALNQ